MRVCAQCLPGTATAAPGSERDCGGCRLQDHQRIERAYHAVVADICCGGGLAASGSHPERDHGVCRGEPVIAVQVADYRGFLGLDVVDVGRAGPTTVITIIIQSAHNGIVA